MYFSIGRNAIEMVNHPYMIIKLLKRIFEDNVVFNIIVYFLLNRISFHTLIFK